MEELYYNNTTAIIDPSWEGQPIKVPGRPSYVQDPSSYGIHSWKHTNPTSLQIDIESVAWQLSNNINQPGQTVSVEQLKKGEPYTLRELKDARDSNNSGDSGNITIDPSSGKIIYDPSNNYYFDPSSGTTNNPNSFGYDGNKNNIPDSMEWTKL